MLDTRNVPQSTTEKPMVPGSVDDYMSSLRQSVQRANELAKHFEERLLSVTAPRPVAESKNPEPIMGRSPLADALRGMKTELDFANEVFGSLLQSLDLP